MQSLNQVQAPYNQAHMPRQKTGLWISRFDRACRNASWPLSALAAGLITVYVNRKARIFR
ncbi:hypothetical protein [Hoeflea poritis]|uniref:Uncharacterized protein n=1 Tax=Hoeflea poritis TaxID=2993659 RepID=A0ABT4VQH5_9HYPH|nr:hypothetical protein [Hoeflea poritis]MDA4846955.1 hypothetical protein [Hoeflea poritis]